MGGRRLRLSVKRWLDVRLTLDMERRMPSTAIVVIVVHETRRSACLLFLTALACCLFRAIAGKSSSLGDVSRSTGPTKMVSAFRKPLPLSRSAAYTILPSVGIKYTEFDPAFSPRWIESSSVSAIHGTEVPNFLFAIGIQLIASEL